MAFNMYTGERHEVIGDGDELLFQLINDKDRRHCAELLRLSDRFYSNPRISPSQAGALVHKLTYLLVANGGCPNKTLARIVVRLLPLFSTAYKTG